MVSSPGPPRVPLVTKETMANNNTENGGTDPSGEIPTNTTVSKMNVSQLKAKVEAQFTALVNGINTLLTNVTEFDFTSGMIAKADLVSKFSSRIAAAGNPRQLASLSTPQSRTRSWSLPRSRRTEGT